VSVQPREQRITDLCGFIVKQVAARKRRRIMILVDGESFGIAGVEEIMNPRGPIPGSEVEPIVAGPEE
jgi:hypothetical protein